VIIVIFDRQTLTLHVGLMWSRVLGLGLETQVLGLGLETQVLVNLTDYTPPKISWMRPQVSCQTRAVVIVMFCQVEHTRYGETLTWTFVIYSHDITHSLIDNVGLQWTAHPPIQYITSGPSVKPTIYTYHPNSKKCCYASRICNQDNFWCLAPLLLQFLELTQFPSLMCTCTSTEYD